MKFFTNKETSKKIIIAILLVMSFNFISPTISMADVGGALFKPISQLLLKVSDLVIMAFQKYFMGVWDIKYGGIKEIESDTYFIRYSPGIIFSGDVAGLKINFINAKKTDAVTTADETREWEDIKGTFSKETLKNKYGFNENTAYIYMKTTDDNWYELSSTKVHTIMTWKDNEIRYTAVKTNADWNAKDWIQSIGLYYATLGVSPYLIFKYAESNLPDTGEGWNLYKLNETPSGEVTKQSSAYILQDTISTWYKALRAIALVGLLSVLVYVGIRILISSTGQEKAKYKKMIGDWLVAICILFVLQYIMLFITETTQKITDVLSINIIGADGEDILMSNLRTHVGDTEEFDKMFAELLMYLVLVIYTVMFTIQYLKRLVYMAFFTMIAPLIALTYPLDKIKDGQAQAFTTWIREYTFNALLQPMHLLLYCIFVSSAESLVTENPIYAIVAIGFLLPAEKFFRKMFGFDKASSAGQLGAAAGGALIMNAINKMGHSSGKQAAAKAGAAGGSSNSSAGLRTASVNPLAGVPGGVNPQPGGPNPQPGGPNPQPGGPNPQPGGPNPQPGGANPQPKRIKGIANLAKNQLFTRQAIQRNLRGVGKVVGGAAGLTAGLAAGISTGDLSNTFSYGAAGTVGGAAAGAGLVNTGFNTYDSAVKGIDNVRYGYQEGAYNEEYAQNAKFDREFKRSEEYKKLLKNYGKDIGVKNGSVDQMLSAGITDTTRMRTILDGMKKYNITDPREAIAYNQLANDCGDSILYDDKKLRMFLDKRGINGDLNTLRQSIINFK